MALMIPPHLTPDARASNGEREVLKGLRDDQPTTDDGWVVMHSLDLRWHVTKKEGEADFLVLAPGLGILVVEVKGCNVTRTNGTWTYHYREPRKTTEGPFKQAHSAMHSLKKWLERRSELRLQGLENRDQWLWHSCVVFTEIDFKSDGGSEWTASEVTSSSQISKDGIATCLRRIFAMRQKELAKEGNRQKPQPVSPKQVNKLVDILRPDLCFDEDGMARIRRLEKAIADATDRQAELALSLVDNPRTVIKGAAGTGKTYVAIRMARYFAEEGLRVGFFCFNNLLAQWLERELGRDLGDKGYVGTLPAFMIRVTGENPERREKDFWEEELPQAAVDQLSSQNEPSRFDIVFVDEAQDLLKQPLLDVLDLLVVGGLASGRWVLAGDFSGQAIYEAGSNEQRLLERLSSRKLVYFQFPLTRNCRNARAVHGAIKSLGLGDYESCLDSGVTGRLTPHWVQDDAHASAKLREVLADLQQGYALEDVVVLSSLADGSTPAALAQDTASRLRRLTGPTPQKGWSGYTTIHAFKGLDARAVIVTDLSNLDGEREKLLYTGISRGRVEVHLILDERLRASWIQRVQG